MKAKETALIPWGQEVELCRVMGKEPQVPAERSKC